MIRAIFHDAEVTFDADGLELVNKHGDRILLTMEVAKKIQTAIAGGYRLFRPNKNWNECQYESHHDTCDCNGCGGDR